jgi:homocysteine S-methyltransferase
MTVTDETHPFLTAIKERPLLCDGAMGTLLYARGASAELSFESLNLSKPELVQQVHIDYINAGAEVVETNSFSGNRFRLAQHGLEDQVWQLNVWAAKLARNAREIAGQSVLVAGSVGPTGKIWEPFGDTKKSDIEEAFRQQMGGLLAGGVDLFMIETMPSIEETVLAVRAARKLSRLPVVAQLSFSVEGRTLMGAAPEDAAALVSELGDLLPDVIGINCGAGPGPVLEYLELMAAALRAGGFPGDKLAFSCLPNAGMPSLVGGRFMYMSRPDYCASFVGKYIELGARLIGGCCGTTPEHIRFMRVALDEYLKAHGGALPRREAVAAAHPAARPIEIAAPQTAVTAEQAAPAEAAGPLGIAPLLCAEPGKSYFVSVELDPPKGAVARKLLQAAQKLARAGADSINVGDSPMARVRMSSMATCLLIQEQVGIQTIIHFTTRDRNLMGIQADLLGCQALGIHTVLALTGDPPSVGTYAHATAVYDVDSIGLIRIISELNRGLDIAGNSIGSPTRLSIGCAMNPTAENRALEIDRVRRKTEAGAHFVMTQPIYQMSDLTDFLHEFGGCPIPILVGIMPLHSSKHAEYLHNEVPGITIPGHIRQAMEKAGEEGARVGLELAEELLEEVGKVAAGVYLVPSFGRYDDMCKLVERLKKKTASQASA